MLLIHCPYCEKDLPELEFANAGQAHIVRPSDMSEMPDEDFEAMFFIRANPKGVNLERWRHAHGCQRFFNAIRDTISDRFLRVYKAGEPRPSDEELAKIVDEVKAMHAKARADGGPVVGLNEVVETAK
ncbi:sarcosine oxidase subunit delta [Ahrensia sp. R2A130]|uniref:sarcosine oxidase subunit delta n=1 Tax=Ahrensia sp. R2A130 TaxID=744979 RepID=UPI0001E0C9FE|nr:sarcosine oxidase subunit delta [Ahrensia sp. R2A130]EFL88810.1 sarcosine oxidase delta subunit family protein [Ahrensia sp. R2A130]